MSKLSFTTEPLAVIVPLVQAALRQHGETTFSVPDPVAGLGQYAGELTPAGRHRPLSTWVDLADALEAHCLTPYQSAPGRIELHYRLYGRLAAPDAAGYSARGDWARVDKLEEPIFLLTLIEAVRRVNPPGGGRVLALGVNAGRELDVLALAFPERRFEIVGVDLEASALAAAQERYPAATFMPLDINRLPQESLGTFDLVLALSLLQSPQVRQDVVLAALHRHHLTPSGGLVLGFPNARYRDGFLSYGARLLNFARPDFSLLMNDVTNARRILQKYGYKVFVTGKYEVLVTGIPAHLKTPTYLEPGPP
ncbi:bifunctional 2-polyprenyl-6-hydroxyphenol methylase/3-demethylubiquinol 3-O-methyltransferase UbiG [Deinococcus sp.]|uniref:class I SAM-dependent methyltransferase n=1 Tax=Deinococcus sp. TaxID=47478 RepID=UPI0025C170CC|nr:class I SAM-dependent methyltransferase [Deinococcus sp.]